MSENKPFGAFDLMLAEPVIGAVGDPRALYVPPTDQQFPKRPAPSQGLLNAVLQNRPLDRLLRETVEVDDPEGVSWRLLERCFPEYFRPDSKVDPHTSYDELEKRADQVERKYKKLNLTAQAKSECGPMRAFARFRRVLEAMQKEGLITPTTMLPEYLLPDLFMAVPVWYFWAEGKSRSAGGSISGTITYFCDRFPAQQWTDMFLLFNHQERRFSQYDGDSIPEAILDRIDRVAPLFDHVVLMTPYHDKVAEEWADQNWARNVDPYVMGFIEGVPAGFILGRFSQSGIFPLHTEMVADTITFIRENIATVLKKDKENGGSIEWYDREEQVKTRYTSGFMGRRFSVEIGDRVDELLHAFERGLMFSWLRGEVELAPATA